MPFFHEKTRFYDAFLKNGKYGMARRALERNFILFEIFIAFDRVDINITRAAPHTRLLPPFLIFKLRFWRFFDKFWVLVPKSFSLRARTMCLLCVSTMDHYYVHTQYVACATTWQRYNILKICKIWKKLNIEKVGFILYCRNFCRWQKCVQNFLGGARFFFVLRSTRRSFEKYMVYICSDTSVLCNRRFEKKSQENYWTIFSL